MLELLGMLVVLITDDMSNHYLVPTDQFRYSSGTTGCPEPHWMAANGSFVTDLNGNMVVTFDFAGCQFGTAKDLRTFRVFDASPDTDTDKDGIPDDLESFLGLNPNDPDSDWDGIPDGDDDFDDDYLTNNRELYEFHTDLGDDDSDDDGIRDGIDIAKTWQDRTFTFGYGAIGAYEVPGVDQAYLRDVGRRVNDGVRGIHSRFVWLNVTANEDAGDGNGDGALDGTEFDDALQHHGEWVDNVWGMGGLYFGLTRGLTIDGQTPAGVGHLLTPAIYGVAQEQITGETRLNLEATIFAHEYGHALGARHNLLTNDPKDVMATYDVRQSYVANNGLANSNWNDYDILSVRGLKADGLYGRQVDFFNGVTTRYDYGYGATTDLRGDQSGSAYFDLRRIQMYTVAGSDTLRVGLTLNGLLAQGQSAAVRFAFDADNNPATGLSAGGGVDGIDSEYTFFLCPRAQGDAFWGTQRRNVGSFEEPGPRPIAQLAFRYNFADSEGSDPVATAVGVLLSKQELELTADQIPVYVQTEPIDQPFNWSDRAAFTLDLTAYANAPQISAALSPPPLAAGAQPVPAAVDGVPEAGDSLDWNAAGLNPNQPYTLSLDEVEVGSGATDGNGDASGSFEVPPGTPGGPHFLTAQDDGGQFAGTIIATVPEPGPGLAAAVVLGLMTLLARIRHRA